jgi:hypothetical protein
LIADNDGRAVSGSSDQEFFANGLAKGIDVNHDAAVAFDLQRDRSVGARGQSAERNQCVGPGQARAGLEESRNL